MANNYLMFHLRLNRILPDSKEKFDRTDLIRGKSQLEQVIEKDKYKASSRLCLALIHRELGNYEGAFRQLDLVDKLHNGSIEEGHYIQAYLFLDKGEKDKAILYFEKLLKKYHDSYHDAYFTLGNLYLEKEQYDDGIRLMSQAINRSMHEEKQITYISLGHTDEKAIDEESIVYGWFFHLWRGYFFRKKEEYAKAISDFEESIKIFEYIHMSYPDHIVTNPFLLNPYCHLGRVYELNNDPIQARQNYREALSLLNQGLFAVKNENDEKAVEIIRNFLNTPKKVIKLPVKPKAG